MQAVSRQTSQESQADEPAVDHRFLNSYFLSPHNTYPLTDSRQKSRVFSIFNSVMLEMRFGARNRDFLCAPGVAVRSKAANASHKGYKRWFCTPPLQGPPGAGFGFHRAFGTQTAPWRPFFHVRVRSSSRSACHHASQTRDKR